MKGKHRDGFSERLGRGPANSLESLSGKKVVWLHAVSVGEVTLAMRFLERMRVQIGPAVYLITVTTATAKEVAARLKKNEDVLLYLPVDFKGAVRCFVGSVRPAVLIVFETEIWPNLMRELERARVPVFLVNGRISDKAIGAYRRIRFFFGPVLNLFSGIGAQDERMRKRFIELGAEEKKVQVTGNMKYEVYPDAESADFWAQKIKEYFSQEDGVCLCIAGSTHEGEEEILLKIYGSVAAKHPGFKLILAPRHTERVPAILSTARGLGVPAARMTGFEEKKVKANNPVLILDKMGVLSSLYAAADVVFMGGSLVSVGGHNLAEPAYFEKAILFGRSMENFKEMADEFIRSGAAISVAGAADLEAQIVSLIGDEARRTALGQAAKRLIFSHQGAIQRNLQMILPTLQGVLKS